MGILATIQATTLGYGSITNYGQPLMNFREARKISNSAWVASYDWGPPMFTDGLSYSFASAKAKWAVLQRIRFI